MTLRSDHAAPETRTGIRLELTVAGRRLEVTRQPPWERPKRRGTGTTTDKAQTWLREYDTAAGAWKDLSRSHQEIGEEITQLLGMSREQFCQVVLLPQGDFARFLRADAEARGKLLGRLFDTHRFAEVEKRLAERRRATESGVRDGDAVLLADAHRMQQAAGDALPLPELAPGDPGLADAVLGWAAVARSTARERLTHAHCARTAAESLRAEAEGLLGGTRERARLQRIFAEARERAALLEERAGLRSEEQARLERSRKAERVAPALDLRETTEAEHRQAASDEARARARLPGTFAQDGAAGLAAAARRVAEELGGLESARRAEQRLAGLAAERADLEREERADETVLQDAEEWLAGWEEVRADLQARIDAAQQDAARAEQFAVQREPAQRRLRAARQRDELARDTEAAQARTLASRERALKSREHWLDLKERRLKGIAAELAAGLVDGEPCTVCGAVEHPRPRRRSPDTSTAMRRSGPSRLTVTPTNSAPRTSSGSASSGRRSPRRRPRPGTPPRPCWPRSGRNWSGSTTPRAPAPHDSTPRRRSRGGTSTSGSGARRTGSRPRCAARPVSPAGTPWTANRPCWRRSCCAPGETRPVSRRAWGNWSAGPRCSPTPPTPPAPRRTPRSG